MEDIFEPRYSLDKLSPHMQSIKDFYTKNGLDAVTYERQGKRVLFLNDKGAQGLEDKTVESLISMQSKAENERNIVLECYSIAADAIRAGYADGALELPFQSGGVIDTGHTNHSINYVNRPDGVVAFDLTAKSGIDKNRLNFAVFAMHAPDMPTLIQRLNSFYGGSWEILPRETIEEFR